MLDLGACRLCSRERATRSNHSVWECTLAESSPVVTMKFADDEKDARLRARRRSRCDPKEKIS